MRQKRSKFSVIKTLTSNFFVVNILQPGFRKTAPVNPFRGVGGGGYTPASEMVRKRTWAKHAARSQPPNYFFARIPQAIFHSHA